jgi:transcription elongation factor
MPVLDDTSRQGIVALQASSIEFVKHMEHVEMSRNSRALKRTFSYASFVAIIATDEN